MISAPPAPRLPERLTLSPLRNGRFDPTIRLDAGEFWRATLTPHGAATVHVDWRDGTVRSRAWGPGADWVLATVPYLVGDHDEPVSFTEAHPLVLRAQHRLGDLRIGASRTLYHDLLPTILGQRITAREAYQQWQRLCTRLGEQAPGPRPDLRLPPTPERLAATPSWWFHPLGIERKRAEPLITVAKNAHHLWQWAEQPSHECARRLNLLPGIGEWTIGLVLACSLGEPDALAVGDYHLKNIISWNLAGEPRGTDERMLELLEPSRGQRGRVARLVSLEGSAPPKFGPRQRVLPMHRW